MSNECGTAKLSVMQEAEGLVNGARAQAYGHPKDNFSRICLLWNAYLLGKYAGEPMEIDEKDHAIFMILVKVARLQETPDHRDSLVDICGYAGTYEKVLERELEEEVAHAEIERLHDVELEAAYAKLARALQAEGDSW